MTDTPIPESERALNVPGAVIAVNYLEECLEAEARKPYVKHANN